MNPYRNEIVAVLNGNEYKLRATFNALVEIEDRLQMNIPAIQTAVFNRAMTVRQCLVVFEQGLAGAGQTYDKGQLLADIEADGIDPFGAAVVDFLTVALFGSKSLKKN